MKHSTRNRWSGMPAVRSNIRTSKPDSGRTVGMIPKALGYVDWTTARPARGRRHAVEASEAVQILRISVSSWS